MNKKIAIIICAAVAAVLIAFLLGRKSAAPAAQSSPSASAQTSETPSGSPSPSAASPEAARALTNDELQSFAKQLNSADNYGFLLSEYSDVRDALGAYHTHARADRRIGTTRVLNPGPPVRPRGGPPSVALLDLETDRVDWIPV